MPGYGQIPVPKRPADGGGWAVRPSLSGSGWRVTCERTGHPDDQPRQWTFTPKSLTASARLATRS
jgi:hypothetical protein